VAALVMGAAGPAAAQGIPERRNPILIVPAQPAPRVGLELSAGYAVLRDSGRDRTLPSAWLAGLGLTFAPRWAIVGEADGAYRTERTVLGDQNYRVHSFMGGVRGSLAPRGRTTTFAQALLGTSCYCGSTVQADGRFSRGVAVQLGGGVDVAVTRAVGLRLQGDVRHVNGNGLSFNQVRIAIGAVVGVVRR
jgi:hypothetical protein